MNIEDIRIADGVFRVYYDAYKNNQMIGTDEVKEMLNLTNQQYNEALLYIESEDFIVMNNKGFGTGAVYKLTKKGFSFFSKTTLEEDLTKNLTGQSTNTNIFNGDVSDSNFLVGNNNNQTNNIEGRKNHLKEIVIGIVVALITAYLVFKFGWN